MEKKRAPGRRTISRHNQVGEVHHVRPHHGAAHHLEGGRGGTSARSAANASGRRLRVQVAGVRQSADAVGLTPGRLVAGCGGSPTGVESPGLKPSV